MFVYKHYFGLQLHENTKNIRGPGLSERQFNGNLKAKQNHV